MDFGTSVLTHGSLDDAVDLDGAGDTTTGDAPEKVCPECESIVPLGVRECPFCGHMFEGQTLILSIALK